jgi:hypothetical protein
VREIVTLLPTEKDRKKLRRLGLSPSIARLIDDDGEHVDFATASEHEVDVLGSFAATAAAKTPASSADGCY